VQTASFGSVSMWRNPS